MHRPAAFGPKNKKPAGFSGFRLLTNPRQVGFFVFNGVMLKTPMPTQHELEMVTLEELVPKDHLLRQIDAAVDFEFIRAKVAHLYCADNGRPALDPVVMFKLLFIGYLFGVRSERQLMREVQVRTSCCRARCGRKPRA